jgi:hypothetical protein
MSDSTPTPVVKPDLSPESVSTAVGTSASAVAKFIPTSVRATLYSVGAAAAVVAIAVAPVLGGTVGEIVNVVGVGLSALANAVAVSHVSN